MTITTQMVWTMPVEESMVAASQIQVDAMVAAGQTDGLKKCTDNSPVIGEVTAERTWIDTTAAQEWIDFIIQYGPISATIVN
jgi:hypothetical protein